MSRAIGLLQVLESQAKDMPEDMFLRYKQLKKKIKSIPVLEPPKGEHNELRMDNVLTTRALSLCMRA